MSDMRQLTEAELAAIADSFGSGPHFNRTDLANEAFGTEMADRTGLFALPYLYRRFGPPFTGCDEYKEIACYWLTTRKEGLCLWVSCKAGKLRLCFGVGFTAALHAKFPWETNREPPNDAVLDCRAALVEAMRELLRPVGVRDLAFNILGPCDESEVRNEAPCSKYAGYGCSRAALDALVAGSEGAPECAE